MEKQFIPYEQALELKELGFDKPCLAWYQDSTLRIDVNANQSIKFHEHLGRFKGCFLAPTFSQAFRWFRKNHGLYSSIIFKKSYPDNHVTGLEWYIIICGGDGVLFDTDGTYTYEEAELACLNKLIEIVKQPKKD